MGWEWVSTAVKWGAVVCRKVHMQKAIVVVRDRATIGILAPLHYQVIHPMQQLSASMEQLSSSVTDRIPDDNDAATQIAIRVCNECRMLMGHALELNANELHCCIKIMVAGRNPGDAERVATWVRSEPLDDRPVENGEDYAHDVSKNSVWASLMGVLDGKNCWRPFPCFSCNDLPAAGELFRCDRENWQQYYKSTLVFPLRYIQCPQSAQFIHMGFLAFDSPKSYAFRGLPSIFDYRDTPTGFRDVLEKRMAFNLGSAMADVLSMCLRPYFKESVQKETENASA